MRHRALSPEDPRQPPSLYNIEGKAEVRPPAQKESLGSRAEYIARIDTTHSPSFKAPARNRSRPGQLPTGILLQAGKPWEMRFPSLLQYLPEELGALSKSTACSALHATAIGDPGESHFQTDTGLLPLKADGRDTHLQADSFSHTATY